MNSISVKTSLLGSSGIVLMGLIAALVVTVNGLNGTRLRMAGAGDFVHF